MSLFIIAVLMLFLFPDAARAYIDPGTGSYAIQVIAAGLFGALYLLKVYWGKVTGFFTGRKPDPEAGKPEPPKNDPPAA